MKRIQQFDLKTDGTAFVALLPTDARVVNIGMAPAMEFATPTRPGEMPMKPVAWMETEGAGLTTPRMFQWITTGAPVPSGGRYIGTAGMPAPMHLYEIEAAAIPQGVMQEFEDRAARAQSHIDSVRDRIDSQGRETLGSWSPRKAR